MKIRPVILCGGSGTRLWPNVKNSQPKQFINFGGWCLLEKTFDRVKASIFDPPIVSTNSKYLKEVEFYLKKHKFKKYKIILEPTKKNTAAAILSSALIKDIKENQPLIIYSADHLIEKTSFFNNAIKKNIKYLNNENIFIFGIKPTSPSTQYGYFLTNKNKLNINVVKKFFEKPNMNKAQKIIKQNGYWNCGMFLLKKSSIINNFKKLEPSIYKNCLRAVLKAKLNKNIYYLNKASFDKTKIKSFDHAILEKTKKINAIKLNVPWSDLGSWKEILSMFNKNKSKYFNKKNIFYRPWGYYVNLFKGKDFLIKELSIKPKGSLSLQKHFHRSEYWLITQGNPKITVNKKIFYKKKTESVFIPKGAIHRIENPYKKSVKIVEAQTGSILKETDIIRYKDIYGRIK